MDERLLLQLEIMLRLSIEKHDEESTRERDYTSMVIISYFDANLVHLLVRLLHDEVHHLLDLSTRVCHCRGNREGEEESREREGGVEGRKCCLEGKEKRKSAVVANTGLHLSHGVGVGSWQELYAVYLITP